MTRRGTVERLTGIADRLRAARDPVAQPANRSPWLRALRGWQSRRLARTFADFDALPHYRKAVVFFLEDLYGEEDVSWRDRDLARMMPTMVRWLPEAMLDTVADALELDWISHVLDLRVATLLESDAGGDRTIDVAGYARLRRGGDPGRAQSPDRPADGGRSRARVDRAQADRLRRPAARPRPRGVGRPRRPAELP